MTTLPNKPTTPHAVDNLSGDAPLNRAYPKKDSMASNNNSGASSGM
jgi:hypothetical protein